MKAALSRLRELKVSTELDTSVARLKYITNQELDKHKRTPLCTRCAVDTSAHLSECRARFEIFLAKELVEAEIVCRAAGSMPSGPDVREIESLKNTQGILLRWKTVNTDQVVEGLAVHRVSWTRVSCTPWMWRWLKRHNG